MVFTIMQMIHSPGDISDNAPLLVGKPCHQVIDKLYLIRHSAK